MSRGNMMNARYIVLYVYCKSIVCLQILKAKNLKKLP